MHMETCGTEQCASAAISVNETPLIISSALISRLFTCIILLIFSVKQLIISKSYFTHIVK